MAFRKCKPHNPHHSFGPSPDSSPGRRLPRPPQVNNSKLQNMQQRKQIKTQTRQPAHMAKRKGDFKRSQHGCQSKIVVFDVAKSSRMLLHESCHGSVGSLREERVDVAVISPRSATTQKRNAEEQRAEYHEKCWCPPI